MHEWCKRGQGLKATYCDVCVCGGGARACPRQCFDVIDDLVPTSAIIEYLSPKTR